MENKMNTTGGLSSTQGKGFWFMGSWIPSTPEKLIPARSNPPTEVRNEYQFGRGDWQNLTGTSNVYSQVIPNNNTGAHHSSMLGSIDMSGGNYGDLTETDHMINNIEGSGFQALLQSEGLGWNDELDEYFTENTDFVSSANRPIFPSLHSQGNSNFKDIDNILINQNHQYFTENTDFVSSANRPIFPSLHSQGNSNFKDIDNILINQNHQYYTTKPRNLDSLLVKSNVVPQFDSNSRHSLTKTMLLPRENHSSESLSSSHCSNLPYQYEFFNPCQPSNERHLEQILQANTMSRNPNTVHVAPIVSPSAKLGKQDLELLDFPVGEQEKEKREIFMTIMQEVTQQQCDGLLQNIVDSSSAAISTVYAETHNSEKGCDQGIYLKRTPQQRTPKRRKHRPKVITEGKPKRTPKPRTTNQSTENTSGKRKYVRKKGLNESATPSADVKVSEYSNTEPAVKSCKRVLNFDREHTGSDSQRKQLDQSTQVRCKDLDYILETQTSEFCVRGDNVHGKSSTVQTGQRDNLLVENMLSGLLSNPNMPNDYNSNSKAVENQLSISIEHDLDDSGITKLTLKKQNLDSSQNRSRTENKYMQRNFYGRILEKENSDLWQNGSIPRNANMQQNFHVDSMWQFVNQTKACNVQKKPTGINLHNPNIFSKPFDSRVGKRDYPCSTVHAGTCPRNVPRSQLPYQEMLHAYEYQNDCNLCSSLNIQKKKKLENIRCDEYSLHKVKSIGAKCLELGEFSTENKQAKVNTGPANHRNVRQMPLEQNFPKQPSDLLLLAEMTGKTSGLAKSLPSLTIIEKHNLLPTPVRKSPIQVAEQAHVSWKLTTLKRKKNLRLISSQSESSVTEKNQSNDFNKGYEHLTDDITWQMKSLDLNDKPNKGSGQEQAIVPYNGSGAIVPSIGSDFIRKRKPRPKVDLDPDTERVWRLLMCKEGSEGLETNKEKEKWWEEEREIFRGRADSFIAKMHLVQGDRRFSRWKGSVVDSVVGVFLTQNVSDHLSSSAFMSLASRYPLKSNTNNRTSNEDAISILIYEPDIRPLISDDTTQWQKQVLDEESFSKSQISTKHQKDSPTSEVAKLSMEGERQNIEEEVISSQDSESSVTQYLGGIRSCSGSNSEAEDCPTGYTSIKNYHLDSTNSQMVSQPTFFPEFYGHINRSTTLDEVSRNGNLQVVDIIQGSPRSGIANVEKIHGRPDLNTPPTNDDSQPLPAPVAPTNKHILHVTPHSEILEVDGCESFSEESTYSSPSTGSEFTMSKDLTSLSFGELGKLIGRNKEQQNGPPCRQGTPCISIQSISEHTAQTSYFSTQPEFFKAQLQRSHNIQSESTSFIEVSKASADKQTCYGQSVHVPEHAAKINKLGDIMPKAKNQPQSANGSFGPNSNEQIGSSLTNYERDAKISNINRKKVGKEKNTTVDWDNLRKQVMPDGMKKERSKDAMDSLDYEAIRLADVHEIANTIKERGMNNLLAERIKDFLNRVVEDHGSIDLEWLRDVPPDKAKDYLLSIRGIGLKSVECVRLLTLHHLAFPVDTNVGRIAVRLGWVPLQPLPESLQLHLLELYPMLESIQKFLWPRLCKLDQRTLYELHYQLITFGKVFCTKNKPNCNACPMRGECRHFASAFASARLALPGPVELGIVSSANPISVATPPSVGITPMPLLIETSAESRKCEPIIEVPLTPEQECTEICASDIEDSFFEDPDDIPTIKFNVEELKTNIKDYIPEGDMSKALVALTEAAASIPTQKLKYVSRLRTEHQVYELPDSHPLLEGMDKREPDDPSPYLLAIWKPGETANSFHQEEKDCKSQDPDRLCNEETCFTCNSIKEANSQTVRGTLLVPCRTAMRGSFPLNGTYFQVNEMFADDESSRNPIVVPRVWIWNLPRRTVYFGTSVTTIFKGLSTEGIQYCFWRGFVCVRAFDRKTRAPRPLTERLHHAASKLAKAKNEKKQ